MSIKNEKLVFKYRFLSAPKCLSYNRIAKKTGIEYEEVSRLAKKMGKKPEVETSKMLKLLFKSDDKLVKFKSLEALYNWYSKKHKKINGKCEYCGIAEDRVRYITDEKNKIFKEAKRFRDNSRGRRGRCLEIDRKNPTKGYSSENCALICYFCNNDKSDVFNNEVEYKNFFQNRKKYINELYEKKLTR